jgi:hypothetical protein
MAAISGTGTVELPGGHVLDGLTIHGKCSQDGTPTPDAPVAVKAVRGRNLAPYLEQGYWAYANGAPAYSATWVRTPKIACTPGQTYTATASNNTYWCGFVYYDASGNFISTDNSKSHAKYEPVHYVSTAPANAAYMAYNINHNDSGNVGSLTPDEVTDFMLVRGGTACAYIPYGSIAIVSTAYEPYRESVSYIDLQGEELCKHSSTGSKYRDVLTIGSDGHVTLEKRTQRETVTAVGTMGGTTTKYASLAVTPSVKRWSSSADAAADGCSGNLWNTMLAQGAACYVQPTWNSLYVYAPQSEGWEQVDFDALVGMEIVDLLPPNDWYTIDLGYVELSDVRDASTLSVIADVEPEIEVATSEYSITGGWLNDRA